MFNIFEQETSQTTIDYHTLSPLIYHPLIKHPNNFLTDILTTPSQTPHNLSHRAPTKLDKLKRLFNATQTIYTESLCSNKEPYIYPLITSIIMHSTSTTPSTNSGQNRTVRYKSHTAPQTPHRLFTTLPKDSSPHITLQSQYNTTPPQKSDPSTAQNTQPLLTLKNRPPQIES